jgi:hypothetical protein
MAILCIYCVPVLNSVEYPQQQVGVILGESQKQVPVF